MNINKVKKLYVVVLNRVTKVDYCGFLSKDIFFEKLDKVYLAKRIVKDPGMSYQKVYYKLISTGEKYYSYSDSRKELGDIFVKKATPLVAVIKNHEVFDSIKFNKKKLLMLEDYINGAYNNKGEETNE